MEQSAVENSHSMMEVSKATDLSVTRMAKCPKSFSIESIIASNDNKSTDIEANASPNYDKIANSSVYFPSNVSMAAAASFYNPWFHNYFMQHQKVTGNVLEMMQMTNAKEKFTEIFAINSGGENRSFSSNDHDRNVPPTATRSIEQYFGSVDNIHEMRLNDMISGVNTDYYKHLSSYGIHPSSDNLESSKSQLINGDEHDTSFHKSGKIMDFDKNARNDDSGADENPDDDVDSDCNSEISLDMSPDGDNNTQGIIWRIDWIFFLQGIA